jgi:hypothetical protein
VLVGRDLARFDRDRKPAGRTPTARAQASTHTGTWQPRWAKLRAPPPPLQAPRPPRPSICGSLRSAGLIDAKSIDLRRLPRRAAAAGARKKGDQYLHGHHLFHSPFRLDLPLKLKQYD